VLPSQASASAENCTSLVKLHVMPGWIVTSPPRPFLSKWVQNLCMLREWQHPKWDSLFSHRADPELAVHCSLPCSIS